MAWSPRAGVLWALRPLLKTRHQDVAVPLCPLPAHGCGRGIVIADSSWSLRNRIRDVHSFETPPPEEGMAFRSDDGIREGY